VRVGLIARGEDRGLANLTWEFYRALRPARTLLVDYGAALPFPVHRHRYPDADVVSYNGTFGDDDVVDRFLDGIDVLYTAETFYDWTIVGRAHDRGIRTVLHVMPEFYRAELVDEWAPTAVWNPTGWRLDRLRDDAVVVPVPVALDRFAARIARAPAPSPPRFLHPVGVRAPGDRNGTVALYRAMADMAQPADWTIHTQSSRIPRPNTRPGGRRGRGRTNVVLRSSGDYWERYAGHDVLVLPRRYGGLCLPLNEAAAAGLALVLPDTPPHREWPGLYVDARLSGSEEFSGGTVAYADTVPRSLAAACDMLAESPETVAYYRRLSREWAEGHSWDVWTSRYRDLFDGLP
jgi:glycosyltransferase involved in cell wall biosynthesis